MPKFIPEMFNVPQQEENVLSFWNRIDAFKNQLSLTKHLPPFIFFDGPPFATGLPHHGNVLAGYLKDTVTRFASTNGFYVERRFGWDCHGLPIENEINKKLGISSPSEVREQIGIAKYNEECKNIVLRYSKQWEKIKMRLGRWIDFQNDYKTMDKSFMENVWYIFAQLYKKGLIYRGFKVMPYSTGLSTPLSNFEANSNYKMVADPEITVKFELTENSKEKFLNDLLENDINEKELKELRNELKELKKKDNEKVNLLAWTTTPWTLPSNLGLCLNPSSNLVLFRISSSKFSQKKEKEENREKKHKGIYICEVSRLSFIKKGLSALSLIPLPFLLQSKTHQKKYFTFPSKFLENLSYKSIFPRNKISDQKEFGNCTENWFKIHLANFVTSETGTGCVQMAPAFGEDDFSLCLEKGVISKGEKILCPVDENGKFTQNFDIKIKNENGNGKEREKYNYKGIFVKDADKLIIEELSKEGKILLKGTYNHSYPFCERSKKPLIYKSVPCWFLAVTKIKEKLLVNNLKSNWVPKSIQIKRFHNWVENARDWAISRTRFWGTPMPIWENEKKNKFVVVSSVEELKSLMRKNSSSSSSNISDDNNKKEYKEFELNDLHTQFVDGIEIEKDGEIYKRVKDVFDCWFESGSMPYASRNFPFSFKEQLVNGSNLSDLLESPKLKELVEKFLPGDFVAEGIDQTRGWFYTLLVISTALYDLPPFKNLIVHGLVLARDGKKMSKHLKNFTDPMEVVKKHGADPLRLYLMSSPVVKGEFLRFKEEEIRTLSRKILNPLYNAFRFLCENVPDDFKLDVNKLVNDYKRLINFNYNNQNQLTDEHSDNLNKEKLYENENFGNIFDNWILIKTNNFSKSIRSKMEEYKIYEIISEITVFADDLTNIYVRLNRGRLKNQKGKNSFESSILTLILVFFDVVRTLSPFAPFFTEYIYLILKEFISEEVLEKFCISNFASENIENRNIKYNFESVHFLKFTEPKLIDDNLNLEEKVQLLKEIVELGRAARDKAQIKIRQPLENLTVFIANIEMLPNFGGEMLEDKEDKELINGINNFNYNNKNLIIKNYLTEELINCIKSELNVKNLIFKTEFGKELEVSVEPLFKELGLEFGKESKQILAFLKSFKFSSNYFEEIEISNKIKLFKNKHFKIILSPKIDENEKNKSFHSNDRICIILDTNITKALKEEGILRNFKSFVQRFKKNSGIKKSDKVRCIIKDSKGKGKLISENLEEIKNILGMEILETDLDLNSRKEKFGKGFEEKFEYDEIEVEVRLEIL